MADNRYIDLFELVRQGRHLEGSFGLQRFKRLLAGLPRQLPDARVNWSLSGSTTIANESFVEVAIRTTLVLECQRCMQLFQWPAVVQSVLQVMASEKALETDEILVDDVDWVAGSSRFDLLDFLEDELILSVPYVPKHEQCPTALPVPESDRAEDDSGRPNPFAVLSKLKKN